MTLEINIIYHPSNTNFMPVLTIDRVLSITQDILTERNIEYDLEEGLRAKYRGEEEDDQGQPISVWTVSYLTPKSMFEQNMHFVRIDDKTGEFLHILRPGGRIM